ncbi:MAG TPA: DUF3106 domain-containing protein [Verrucomicrobiae bacterium]
MMAARVSILFLFALMVGTIGAAESAPVRPPAPPSPIEDFRRWLQMPEADREKELAGYPEPKREVLRKKLGAYEGMTAEQREARLINLELRWYLQPLMKVSPADRGNYLRLIPERLHSLVQERLAHWDQMDERTRTEILADERKRELATRYFVHARRKTTNATTARVMPPMPPRLQEHFARLDQQGNAARAKIPLHLNNFFAMTPEAQRAALLALSESERQEMQKTLEAFARLSRSDRELALISFGKFANLPPEERADFQRNAARWQEFTPEERASWRELVRQLPPMPPMPVPRPPMPAGGGKKVATTNQNAPGVN